MAAAQSAMQKVQTLREILKAADEAKALADVLPMSRTADEKFGRFGEFLIAVAQSANFKYRGPLHPALMTFKDKDEPAAPQLPPDGKTRTAFWAQKTTINESVGAQGGFLVPTEFRAELLAIDPMTSPIRARATVIPMRRRVIQIPVLDQTGTTEGAAHWFGGMVASWTEEGALKTQSDPTFRQAALTAHKLVCYTRSTDELLDDSAIGLEAFLRGPMGFAGAIRWYEEYAFIQGTGVGQPLGIINAGATITVTATASPPAPASIFVDLVNMLENFLPGANGIWVINQRHMSDLLTMSGPSGNASYLWGSAADGVPNRLLGFPVIWSEKLSAPGSTGSILLIDPAYYLIGDRQAETIDATNVERFQYDETSWRCVHRVDGQPWLSAPIYLADGVATVSPFVMLGAKST
jgi:HK97 family phage major capsid protein